MSMSAHNEYHAPETMEDTTLEPRRGASPVLWMLLAFAVAAAALLWWGQSRQVADVQPAVTSTPAPAVESGDAAAAPPASERATASRERAQRPAAAVDRAPRPVQGNAEPRYPASMLRAGVGGTVVVVAEVDANGTPVEVRIAQRSGERELDRAALNAVRQWRFEPALRNGKAIASTVRVPVDFKPI